MRASSPAVTANAKPGGALSCTPNEQLVHLNAVIAETAKAVFDKPFRVLCDVLHLGERTAKYRLAKDRDFTGAELAALIRTDEGFQFITAIMADAPRKPEWWRVCAPLMEAADIRKMQMAAQRRVAKALGEALDADKFLSQAIARADALAVHDEEHSRPYSDALRSMRGLPNSTVASTKRR